MRSRHSSSQATAQIIGATKGTMNEETRLAFDTRV